MTLLIQFLLRLSFGMAAGMALTSSKQVTSGYFRNHLYVTLGLTSLAAVLCWTNASEAFLYAVGAAVCSYLGAVYWLFEKSGPGKMMLLIVALTSLLGASSQTLIHNDISEIVYSENSVSEAISAGEEEHLPRRLALLQISQGFLSLATVVSSGLLLGITMATMLLGHWYLNSPTMQMTPLRRLVILMAGAVVLRTVISSLGLWGEIANTESFSTQWLAFIALRWTFGLLGVAILTWMAWQTLKATGILYVAVIGTFVGETMSLLLSSESLFPL